MPFQAGRQFCLRPSVICGILFPIFKLFLCQFQVQRLHF